MATTGRNIYFEVLLLHLFYSTCVKSNVQPLIEVDSDLRSKACVQWNNTHPVSGSVKIDTQLCPATEGTCKMLRWKISNRNNEETVVGKKIVMGVSAEGLVYCTCRLDGAHIFPEQNGGDVIHLCKASELSRNCVTHVTFTNERFSQPFNIEIRQCTGEPDIALDVFWYEVSNNSQACSSVNRTAMSGNLRVLGSPENGCLWEIEAPQSMTIKVDILQLAVQSDAFNCSKSGISFMDSGTQMGTYCGDDIPSVLISKTNKLRILVSASVNKRAINFQAFYTIGSFRDCDQFSSSLIKLKTPRKFIITSENINCLNSLPNSSERVLLVPIFQAPHDLRDINVNVNAGRKHFPPFDIRLMCGITDMHDLNISSIKYKYQVDPSKVEGSLNTILKTRCHINTILLIVRESNKELMTATSISVTVERISSSDIPECIVKGNSTDFSNASEVSLTLFSPRVTQMPLCQFQVPIQKEQLVRVEINESLNARYVCSKIGLLLDVPLTAHHTLDLSCYANNTFRSIGNGFFIWLAGNFTVYVFDYFELDTITNQTFDIHLAFEDSCQAKGFEMTLDSESPELHIAGTSKAPECFIVTYIQEGALNDEAFRTSFANVTTQIETDLAQVIDTVMVPHPRAYGSLMDLYHVTLKPFPVVNKTNTGYKITATHLLKTDTLSGKMGSRYWSIEFKQPTAPTKRYPCGTRQYNPTAGIIYPDDSACSFTALSIKDEMPVQMICEVERNNPWHLEFELLDYDLGEFCYKEQGFLKIMETVKPAFEDCRQFDSNYENPFDTNKEFDFCRTYYYGEKTKVASIGRDNVTVTYGWNSNKPLPRMSFKVISNTDKVQSKCSYTVASQNEIETYKGIKYTTVFGKYSWNQASSVCKKKGASLLTIDNQETLDVIKGFIASVWMRQTYGYGVPSFLFIGLKVQRNREFWWESGKPYTFARWYHKFRTAEVPKDIAHIINTETIQPIANGDHRCAAMYLPNPSLASEWFTIPCYHLIKDAQFICEQRTTPYQPSPDCDDYDTGKPSLSNTHNCPPGKWIGYGGKCFMLYNTNYHWNKKISYMFTVTRCQAAGGKVANIDELTDMLPDLTKALLYSPENGCIYMTKSNATSPVCVTVSFENGKEQVKVNSLCMKLLWFRKVCKTLLCTAEKEMLQPAKLVCPSTAFECDGMCISNAKVCDGISDCSDGSDERDDKCRYARFKCRGNEYLHLSRVCDFVSDCTNNKDEESCIQRNCSALEHRCNNGQCIDSSLSCNLKPDCVDNSDESHCHEQGICRFFQCESGKCIRDDFVNDGIADCPGFSDEDPPLRLNNIVKDILSPRAKHNQKCLSLTGTECQKELPKCIDRARVCIADRRLETTCPSGQHLRFCSKIECPGWTFKCPNSYCVPYRYVCDGENDCLDGEDETICDVSRVVRCKGAFACPNSDICIPLDEVCDGLSDCPSGEDEETCETLVCPEGCFCGRFSVVCDNATERIIPLVGNSSKLLVLTNSGVTSVNFTYFASFHSLLKLDLSHNAVEDIASNAFVDCVNLRVIDLQFNKIHHLSYHTFAGLQSVTELLLNSNFIESISPGAFEGLIALKHLDLSSMFLTEIEGRQFVGLRSLQKLLLTGNKITVIHKGAFTELDKLRYLDIQNNPLKLIDNTVFSAVALDKLLTPSPSFCCYAKSRTRECLPSPDAFSSCSDLLRNEAIKILIWIVGLLALLGNVFVVISRIVTEYKSFKVVTLLVINLAVSDFMMGIYLIMIAVADLQYRGEYYRIELEWRESRLCQTAGTLAFLSSEMSLCIISLITLDRMLAVKLAMRYSSKSGIRAFSVAVVVCWIFAVIVSTIPLSNIDYFDGFYSVTGVCLPFTLEVVFGPGWHYTTAITIVFNLLTLIFVTVGHIWIYCHVRTSHKTAGRDASVEQIILARRLAMVVLSDVACWLPIIVCSIAALAQAHLGPSLVVWIAVFILPVNAALNPILYTLSNVKICRRKKTLRQINKNAYAGSRERELKSLIKNKGSQSSASTTTSQTRHSAATTSEIVSSEVGKNDLIEARKLPTDSTHL